MGTQNNGEDWNTKDTHQEQSLTHSAENSVQTKAAGDTWNQVAMNSGLPIVFKLFVISITSVLLSQQTLETNSQNKTNRLAIIEPRTCSVGRCEPSQSSCPWLCGSGTRSWSVSRSTGGPLRARSDGSSRCTLRGGTPALGAGSARWRTWCAVYEDVPPCGVSLPLQT